MCDLPCLIHQIETLFLLLLLVLTKQAMHDNQSKFFSPRVLFALYLQNLIPALEQVLDAEADVLEVEQSHDAVGWQDEIAKLTNELEELMSRGTPARKVREGVAMRGGSQSSRSNGVSSNGKRTSSGGGGASSGRESKKKKASDGVGSRSRPTKRARRSS